MTPATFNAFCATLPHAFHVVQWGGADVWKVGDAQGDPKGAKVFAVGAWHHGRHAGITFKVTPMVYDILLGAPGLRPAPYFASRGMAWMQCHGDGPTDDEVKGYIAESHRLAAQSLTKARRRALGLLDD